MQTVGYLLLVPIVFFAAAVLLFYLWRAIGGKDKDFFTLQDFLLIGASFVPVAWLLPLFGEDLPWWADSAIGLVGGVATYFLICALLERVRARYFSGR